MNPCAVRTCFPDCGDRSVGSGLRAGADRAAPTPVSTVAPLTAVPPPIPTAVADILATSASLDTATSVAFAAEGKLYFSTCDYIYAIVSAGMMKLIAGGGPALNAGFRCIAASAFDNGGPALEAQMREGSRG